MLSSPHLIVKRARVGSAALRHQDVRVLDGALTLAVALAPPRLWGYLLDATLDGFAEGYARPHDGKASTRIHQGLRVAQAALRARTDGLLDRRAADVALLALASEGNVVHLLSTGSLRAYVYRQRSLRRLTSRDPPAGGVLQAEPAWCAEPVEPGDLVFAASSSLCSDANLERVRAACMASREIDPAAIAEMLGRAAAEARQSAAIAAFQVGA